MMRVQCTAMEPARVAPRFDVELISVTKRYEQTVAVDAISLRIPPESYCCLLGPSGCGKTSTLRMIAGHEQITEGDILIRDRNVTDLPTARRGTGPGVMPGDTRDADQDVIIREWESSLSPPPLTVTS